MGSDCLGFAFVLVISCRWWFELWVDDGSMLIVLLCYVILPLSWHLCLLVCFDIYCDDLLVLPA